MGNGSEHAITETTREVYELCCKSGARIRYRTLRLKKLDHPSDHDRWRVTRDGDYIDTINVDAFASASQLQRWLDAVSRGEDDPATAYCDTCPLRPVPGD